MMNLNFPLQLTNIEWVILFLATWRLASLLADENGPQDIFYRLRTVLGVKYETVKYQYAGTEMEKDIATSDRMLGRMILCIWCNSFWIGVVETIGILLVPHTTILLLTPFALSAMAVYISGLRKYA
jgi:hypothetical protein